MLVDHVLLVLLMGVVDHLYVFAKVVNHRFISDLFLFNLPVKLLNFPIVLLLLHICLKLFVGIFMLDLVFEKRNLILDLVSLRLRN